MKIKICGITNYEDAYICYKLGVDYIGFNFYKKSKRYAKKNQVKKIIQKLGKGKVKYVGIFVKEKISKILQTVEICKLDAVQIHGDENKEYVEKLKAVMPKNIELIKAFRVKDLDSIKCINEYNADFCLFDSYKKYQYGGTGERFDYSLLHGLKCKFFLAGGISKENISEVVKLSPYALDINSGVEKESGKKDQKKIGEIVKVIRNEIKY